MTKARVRCGGMAGGSQRKPRLRTVPKWLLRSQEVDACARGRCLLVLSVLSGEQPVTDAIAEANLSRATYYKLETKALLGMLAGLNPLTAGAVGAPWGLAGPRIEALEAKVKRLLQEKRRAERLLMLTRKTLKTPELKGRPGRPRKDPYSTPRPTSRSLSSNGKAAASEPSTPTASGAAGP